MQVVILAGGLGTRLGILTRRQPKSMVKIEGKPFLAYQLEFLRRAGVKDIIMCIGHLGEHIEHSLGDGAKFDVSIKYCHEDKPLGTGGALRRSDTLLKDVFFTLYGDSYLFLDFAKVMRYFRSSDKLSLMTVYKNCDRYEQSNVVVDGRQVKKFSKVEKTPDMVYIEYGVNIFNKKVLDMIPDNIPYSLDSLFPRLIEKEELLAFEVNERYYQIGSPEGLKEFARFVRRNQL